MSVQKPEQDALAMRRLEKERGTLQPARYGGWEWLRWIGGKTVKSVGDTPTDAILAGERPDA